MSVSGLKRKELRNVLRAKNKRIALKRLLFMPVISTINIEEIKATFKKN